MKVAVDVIGIGETFLILWPCDPEDFDPDITVSQITGWNRKDDPLCADLPTEVSMPPAGYIPELPHRIAFASRAGLYWVRGENAREEIIGAVFNQGIGEWRLERTSQLGLLQPTMRQIVRGLQRLEGGIRRLSKKSPTPELVCTVGAMWLCDCCKLGGSGSFDNKSVDAFLESS